MKNIRIKRVYSEPEPSDGFRVLVDKLWPRGVRKENLRYDLWAKDLAPSTELRIWFHADPDDNWEEFRLRYLHELKNSEYAADFIKTIRQYDTVTLLYASKNPDRNHALVLQEYLEKTYVQ